MLNIFYNGVSNGPGKVVTNLILGLQKLNAPFKTNQQILPNDKVLFLQNHYQMSFPIDNDKIIGPNICTLPIDNEEMMKQNYKKTIVPCEWVKQLYLKWLPEDKVSVWAVGINTDLFFDMSNEDKTIDCLVYFKRRDESELESVISFLEENNQTYEIIRYGSYSEDYFLNTLKKSRYGIVIDKCESQGIAIEEMMSTNLPLLVWDTIIWDDRGLHVSVPATSVPYWDDTCGIKVNDFETLKGNYSKFINNIKTYKPRDYILNNLSLDLCATNLLNNF
jgi:hypothetical protein